MQTESENERFITKRKTNIPTIKYLRGPVRQCVWVRFLFVSLVPMLWQKLEEKTDKIQSGQNVKVFFQAK